MYLFGRGEKDTLGIPVYVITEKGTAGKTNKYANGLFAVVPFLQYLCDLSCSSLRLSFTVYSVYFFTLPLRLKEQGRKELRVNSASKGFTHFGEKTTEAEMRRRIKMRGGRGEK